MNIALNKKSQHSIEKVTGISFDEILSLDVASLDSKIEKKIGRKLKFKPVRDERLLGRGSVFLYLNRFFDFNHKKLDKIIDRL